MPNIFFLHLSSQSNLWHVPWHTQEHHLLICWCKTLSTWTVNLSRTEERLSHICKISLCCSLFPGTDIFEVILLCLLGINYCMNVGGKQSLISRFKNCKCSPLSLPGYWQQNHRLISLVGYSHSQFQPCNKWPMEVWRIYFSTVSSDDCSRQGPVLAAWLWQSWIRFPATMTTTSQSYFLCKGLGYGIPYFP